MTTTAGGTLEIWEVSRHESDSCYLHICTTASAPYALDSAMMNTQPFKWPAGSKPTADDMVSAYPMRWSAHEPQGKVPTSSSYSLGHANYTTQLAIILILMRWPYVWP